MISATTNDFLYEQAEDVIAHLDFLEAVMNPLLFPTPRRLWGKQQLPALLPCFSLEQQAQKKVSTN